MANLIITIVSLAIFAIVAASAIYYGGQAFANAQINALATTIVAEAQQILVAERIWSTNNNQPDISGMSSAAHSGMSLLVNSKSLEVWPPLAGTLGLDSTTISIGGPQPNNANVSTGAYDQGCYNFQGYIGKLVRFPFSYNNGNYIAYALTINSPYTGSCLANNGSFAATDTDVSQINHPMVKIAKAINAALNQIPSNADMAPMAYVGLPRPPTTSSYVTSAQVYDVGSFFAPPRIVVDSNGTLQSNYCYLSTGTGSPGANVAAPTIVCVFGPS